MEKINNNLTIDQFAQLMLALLATKDESNTQEKMVALLPANYRQIIQNIMCACNGWTDEFSVFIDLEEYFDDHFYWETRLALAIENVILNVAKDHSYDIRSEKIMITFENKEIMSILSKYPECIIEKMNHFTNLLVDYIYTREYQEKFIDYSAAAVKTMRFIKKYGYDETQKELISETFKNYTDRREPLLDINAIIKSADRYLRHERTRVKKKKLK